ncbi:Hypothetical predicted protein [Octopus vulgaris]|uniref:Uncharacterized protein n=1 Tax=Octopus vulgaris TaxID=6645 RepID=A0AA36BGY5_OCTVU|nr:Hypothetical predicted protein [Octopus vulgaris]
MIRVGRMNGFCDEYAAPVNCKLTIVGMVITLTGLHVLKSLVNKFNDVVNDEVKAALYVSISFQAAAACKDFPYKFIIFSGLTTALVACDNRFGHRSHWSQDLEGPCGQCYSFDGAGHCGRHFGNCLILFVLFLGKRYRRVYTHPFCFLPHLRTVAVNCCDPFDLPYIRRQPLSKNRCYNKRENVRKQHAQHR